MKEVGETKRTLAETHEEVRANEARAATTKRALGGAVNRAEEQSNNQGAIQLWYHHRKVTLSLPSSGEVEFSKKEMSTQPGDKIHHQGHLMIESPPREPFWARRGRAWRSCRSASTSGSGAWARTWRVSGPSRRRSPRAGTLSSPGEQP